MPSELIASALPVGSPALAKVSEHERLRILGKQIFQLLSDIIYTPTCDLTFCFGASCH